MKDASNSPVRRERVLCAALIDNCHNETVAAIDGRSNIQRSRVLFAVTIKEIVR
jgi:hypothetical protein